MTKVTSKNVWWAPVIYTEEVVIAELKDVLSTLKENKDIVYIWELFESKEYSRTRYSEWINKYSENKEIQRLSYTIKDILESRAVKWAMTGKLNPTFTIFHMKNNFKWVDKQEISQTNLNLDKNVSDMSDEELDRYINWE